MRTSFKACLLATLALTACALKEPEWSSEHPVFVNMVKEVRLRCDTEDQFFSAKPVYYTSLEEAKTHTAVRPVVVVDKDPTRYSDDERRKPEDAPCAIGDLTFKVEIEDKVKNFDRFGFEYYSKGNPGRYKNLFEFIPYHSGINVPYATMAIYKREKMIGIIDLSKRNQSSFLEYFGINRGVVKFIRHDGDRVYEKEIDSFADSGKNLIAVGITREDI